MTTARDPGFIASLRASVRGEVRADEPLARYSTYRIGGPATVLLPAGNEDVGAALRAAAGAGVPWFALGLGSNILLPDEGMDALVIRLGKGTDRLERDADRWTVGGVLETLVAEYYEARKMADRIDDRLFVAVPSRGASYGALDLS